MARDQQQRTGVSLSVNFFLDAYDARTGAYLGQRLAVHNMVPTTGLNVMVKLLSGTAASGLEYFAMGTGTGANSAGMTQLTTERLRDIITQFTESGPSLILKYYLSSAAGNGLTFTEAGLFGNGATGALNSGTLFARATFTGANKTSAEAWTFTWTVTAADDGVGV